MGKGCGGGDEPTLAPTAVPTPQPTAEPTAMPTPEPTAMPTPAPTSSWHMKGPGCCGWVNGGTNKIDHPKTSSLDNCKQRCIADFGDRCGAIDFFNKTKWCTSLQRSDEVHKACTIGWDAHCKARDDQGSTVYQHGDMQQGEGATLLV